MINKDFQGDIDLTEGEVILINKPYEWTSFDIVKFVRNNLSKALGLKKIKVGHAGTLDPLATGLLIVCVGKQTKNIVKYQGLEKEYTGSFLLGATTPSFDMETEVNQTFSIENISEELIIETSKKFIGSYQQYPPIFSAKQIKGKRAYKYARKGQEIEMKSKLVNINQFEIINISFPEIEFKISCSKGTYIRSVVNDFGKAMDSGAYLSSLCRTKIGSYSLSEALEVDDFKKMLSSNIEAQQAI
ncbi:MAG: tRNA pseudouridine(55) synthase TruB [Bacteroidetes bacterium]|nr:tRNA pseudouridine(55) synthase TruB [Bacteroidota bacterium]